MKKIVLACQKGGVAKSTTAYTMAAGLYNDGYKVLMIDTDPQANLSFTARLDVTSVQKFKGTIPIDEAINNSQIGFDIVTGGLNMVSADMKFTQTARESRKPPYTDERMDEALKAVYRTGKLDYLQINKGTFSKKISEIEEKEPERVKRLKAETEKDTPQASQKPETAPEPHEPIQTTSSRRKSRGKGKYKACKSRCGL